MDLTDLLLIVLSSVAGAGIISVLGLAWVHQRHLVKVLTTTQYQASATREHTGVLQKVIERLEAQNATSTHMAMVLSKSVSATEQLAKANERLASEAKLQSQAMFQLADISTNQAVSSSEMLSLIRDEMVNGKARRSAHNGAPSVNG